VAHLRPNEFMCCTDHLTTFAVAEFDLDSAYNMGKTRTVLTVMNVFLVLFSLIAAYLDR
jgi:hypothetical protein